MAYPRYKPSDTDRKRVETLSAVGLPQDRIAAQLGVDLKTLRKYFRDELDRSADKANSTIAGVLFEAARRGEAWAVCFWLKCRAGWREVERVEHAGIDGSAIKIVITQADEKL